MIHSSRKIYPFYILTDVFFIVLSFFIPYLLKYGSSQISSSLNIKLPNFEEYVVIFILWGLFIIITLNRKGFYATDRSLSIPKEAFRVSINILYVSIFVAGLIFFTKYQFFSREIFFSNFVLLCVLLSGWRALKRLVLRKLISQGFKNVNVLIVGAGKIGESIAAEIYKNPYWGFKISGFLDDSKVKAVSDLPILGTLSNFISVAKKYFIDEVIISIPSERKAVSELIKQAQKMNLGLRIIPDSFEEPLPVVEITNLGLIPLLTYKERKHHPAEFALKRLFDILVSLILLILLLPVFLIVSILIKIDSKGPVFYIRKRSGFKGKIFSFYKFRSMGQDADKQKADLLSKNESKGNLIFKMKKDPRVTSVGKFLRRYSLDELPQIFNVLKGDMSLVGPRPFPVEESDKFQYEHLQRLTVRPGITGLAQIRGRSDLSVYRWIKWDLWYVNNWSFRLDFLILWWTIPVVLKGRGAY
ncbi:MAG: sugar transferase [Candidatus Omnitrophica bacterium]|nr:sugar transferase [Candidatus Omnitrophota bacterium]